LTPQSRVILFLKATFLISPLRGASVPIFWTVYMFKYLGLAAKLVADRPTLKKKTISHFSKVIGVVSSGGRIGLTIDITEVITGNSGYVLGKEVVGVGAMNLGAPRGGGRD